MQLKDIGEFGLIRRFTPLFSTNIPKGVEGIGNDCAVIPASEGHSFLITTDLLVENTHFIRYQISAADLGFKSLSVNLSDIAAMGGTPRYAFLSVALPVDSPMAWIDDFMGSFRDLANETGVLLLGGDTTRSSLIAVNVLIIGEIETQYIKRRSQAKPGDIICCTGNLGDSGGGLKILMDHLPQEGVAEKLIEAHFRPQSRLKEGAWLARQTAVHAMMDISDGLSSDIHRIMEESQCGAHIEVDLLPLSDHLKTAAVKHGWQAEEIALSGGEDYCLLVTVDPQHYDSLKKAYFEKFHQPLYTLGKILPGSDLLYTLDNKIFHPASCGFDHFKSL